MISGDFGDVSTELCDFNFFGEVFFDGGEEYFTLTNFESIESGDGSIAVVFGEVDHFVIEECFVG